jgi:hypothetical protein
MLGEWLGGDPALILPGAPALTRADGGSLIL